LIVDIVVGTVNYQLVATDDEGDIIMFELANPSLLFGTATLSSTGL
jgi:hypothetical protein